jgi:hypothetical protein
MASEDAAVRKYIDGKKIARIVVVPNNLVSVVVQ